MSTSVGNVTTVRVVGTSVCGEDKCTGRCYNIVIVNADVMFIVCRRYELDHILVCVFILGFP